MVPAWYPRAPVVYVPPVGRFAFIAAIAFIDVSRHLRTSCERSVCRANCARFAPVVSASPAVFNAAAAPVVFAAHVVSVQQVLKMVMVMVVAPWLFWRKGGALSHCAHPRIERDGVAFSSVNHALSKANDTGGAERIFQRMRSRGITPNIVAYSTLARPSDVGAKASSSRVSYCARIRRQTWTC